MRMRGAKGLAWIILVPLIVGLAGFGISDMLQGGLSTTVATVGEEKISVDDFSRAMSRELRRQSQAAGREITMAEARMAGLDRQVLGTLTRRTAIDAETRRIGLSVSDATVQEEIAAIPGFQGPDGKFSPEQARLALQQAQIGESELRDEVRAGTARGLVEAALVSGTRMPPVALATVLAFQGERRSFAWVRLDADRFGGDPAAPTEAELAAWHSEKAADFTTPETRAVTYALIDPAEIARTLEVAEEDLRREYEARIASFRTPERRSLSRLTFPTAAEAEAARARIAAGETTLLALAEARGLTEANISLGEMAADALPGPVRDAVFGMTTPGLAGPVDTDLGPALYEVHAILAASETPFETAKAGLREGLALERAREEAPKRAARVEDLVAAGARIEEIVREAGLVQGTIDVPVTQPGEGLAADPEFRRVALAAPLGTEADLAETADGRYFVLRVDEVRPAALKPLESVRGEVEAAILLSRRLAAAREAAEALAARLRAGETLATAAQSLGLTPAEAGPVTRDGTVEGVPAAVLTGLFEAQIDGTASGEDATGVVVAQLRSVQSFDPTMPENVQLVTLFQDSLDQAFASDLYTYYGFAVETRDRVMTNPAVIESVLSRFP